MRDDALRLEAVDGSDDPFLFDLFFQTRRGMFAPLGWDEDQLKGLLRSQYEIRQAQYRIQHPGATTEKICADGAAVGRLDTAQEGGRLHIIDVAVAPGVQGRGIGSSVLQQLLEEADASNLVADLHVETTNPARRLYERLGFVERSGDGINLFMERQPAVPSAESIRRFA